MPKFENQLLEQGFLNFPGIRINGDNQISRCGCWGEEGGINGTSNWEFYWVGNMCTVGMIIPNHISKYTLPLGKLKIFVDAVMEKQNIYHGNGTRAQLHRALAVTTHGLPFWRVCRFGIGRVLVHLILTLRTLPAGPPGRAEGCS